MNLIKFGQLVIGEKFNLPGSTELLIKETLTEASDFGWVNARYDNPYQGQPRYFADETPVKRKRSNQDKEIRPKSQVLQYQCITCQGWVEENNAAMSKEGVMCLACYALTLKPKPMGDEPLSPLLTGRYQNKR